MTRSIRRILTAVLAVALAGGSLSSAASAAPQATGAMSGKATDEAKKPYTDYKVLLRDIATGQVAKTLTLDQNGLFAATGLPLSRYLIELYKIKDDKVVCTEGPYALTTTLLSKTDVNINCGTNPALWWVVAGGAVAAIAIAVRSSGK